MSAQKKRNDEAQGGQAQGRKAGTRASKGAGGAAAVWSLRATQLSSTDQVRRDLVWVKQTDSKDDRKEGDGRELGKMRQQQTSGDWGIEKGGLSAQEGRSTASRWSASDILNRHACCPSTGTEKDDGKSRQSPRATLPHMPEVSVTEIREEID